MAGGTMGVAEVEADLPPSPAVAPPTKGERTRQRILALAIQRFGSRGFRRTSVSEIARSAGLTQAAAYAYFENKDALFRAAVDADVSGMIDEISAQLTGTDIRRMIPSIVVFAMASLPDHPLTHRILAGREPDEIPRLAELPAMERFGDLLTIELAEAQARGEVRPDFEPRRVATGIEPLVLGLLFMTVQSGGEVMPRHAEGVVEAFDLMVRPIA